MKIEHLCDQKKCSDEATECFCKSHLDEKIKEAYDDGYNQGQMDEAEKVV